MIVDVHTHIWQTPDQLGRADLGEPTAKAARRASRRGRNGAGGLKRIPPADCEQHWQSARPVDKSVVLGFTSRLLRAEVPNAFVADYVRRHPEKLVGFAGIDPTDPAAYEKLLGAFDDLGLHGVVLSPSNQGFHPADTRAMAIYAECQRRGKPVLIHPGGHLAEQTRLEFARPLLLDEVARSFPKLPIILAQLGQPWTTEATVLLAKHRHVFADCSGLLGRPWQAYNALVGAWEHGVIDKVLFGSDFPYTSASDGIEALYSVNLLAQGTNFPIVPREALRGIVERDTLALLGIA
jgi:predicted TIM-barrel fold metal-dependent hydrolase